MAWIHCGLDSLWLGSNLTSLRPEGQVANNCNNLLQFITTLTPYGLDSLWLGLTVVWIHCGLAQISRAYGQRAKSLTLLARVTIYYNPHPYGLDSLCLGLDNWTNFGQFSCSIYNLVNIAPWGEWKLTNWILLSRLFGQNKFVQFSLFSGLLFAGRVTKYSIWSQKQEGNSLGDRPHRIIISQVLSNSV